MGGIEFPESPITADPVNYQRDTITCNTVELKVHECTKN